MSSKSRVWLLCSILFLCQITMFIIIRNYVFVCFNQTLWKVTLRVWEIILNFEDEYLPCQVHHKYLLSKINYTENIAAHLWHSLSLLDKWMQSWQLIAGLNNSKQEGKWERWRSSKKVTFIPAPPHGHSFQGQRWGENKRAASHCQQSSRLFRVTVRTDERWKANMGDCH